MERSSLSLLVPGAAMASFWGLLFLVGLATTLPVNTMKTLEEVLSQVVAIYNQGPRVQNAFRLLDSGPLGLDSTSKTLQQLKFTLQETMCLASQSVIAEQCEFKPNGLRKDCTGYFSTEPGNPTILINCDSTAQEPVRVTRFRGVGPFLKGFSRGIRFWDSNQ